MLKEGLSPLQLQLQADQPHCYSFMNDIFVQLLSHKISPFQFLGCVNSSRFLHGARSASKHATSLQCITMLVAATVVWHGLFRVSCCRRLVNLWILCYSISCNGALGTGIQDATIDQLKEVSLTKETKVWHNGHPTPRQQHRLRACAKTCPVSCVPGTGRQDGCNFLLLVSTRAC